jgi:predicted methyltransferase/DNA-directed RNA polymerase subunit RPC12/RpoP
MSKERIVAEVAGAVGLAEGEAGVRDVLRTVARLEPVAVRAVSRATELPVPFVAAICNELRKRGVVSRQRPVQLTIHGRELFGAATLRLPFDATCAVCAGREIVIPPVLAPTVEALAGLAENAPTQRVELDQAHCTVETKVRRVLAMYEAGALDDRRVLMLGDDDLTSLALKLVVEQLGAGSTIRKLVVVDVDPALVSFVARELRTAPFDVECIRHDLREPLPEAMQGTADTVFTDPPYTSPGTSLFLSRAVDALDGPRGDVFLAFGAGRPEEHLTVQRAIADMGFLVRRLARNFNEYLGAGALGGTSHLYHLAATTELRPLVVGRYDGPLYTGDFRPPVRDYRCRGCGRALRVGRGRRWSSVRALKRDRCPHCRGSTFVPLPREAA